MYMKVNTSLYKGDANQWDDKKTHGDFYPRVHLVATKLVPVVSTVHLVVRELIGVHKSSLVQRRHKNLHK